MRSRLSDTGRSLRTTGQPQTFCSRPIPSDARPGCEECLKQRKAGLLLGFAGPNKPRPLKTFGVPIIEDYSWKSTRQYKVKAFFTARANKMERVCRHRRIHCRGRRTSFARMRAPCFVPSRSSAAFATSFRGEGGRREVRVRVISCSRSPRELSRCRGSNNGRSFGSCSCRYGATSDRVRGSAAPCRCVARACWFQSLRRDDKHVISPFHGNTAKNTAEDTVDAARNPFTAP